MLVFRVTRMPRARGTPKHGPLPQDPHLGKEGVVVTSKISVVTKTENFQVSY
jgi:hypothetical protein